ncbi:MAG: Fic family protein [Eubacteriales bacterium]
MRDPYLYPNSTVLKNMAEIKVQDRLDEMEAEYCSFRLSQLVMNTSNIDMTVDGLCGIHAYIFQDIYEWAGEFRAINIEKSEPALGGVSIEYSEYDNIKEELDLILEEMRHIEWSCLDLKDLTEVFSKSMAELWKIHPFREGNTRTIVTFCSKYIEQMGICIHSELFEENAVYMRTALVAASALFSDELGDKRNYKYLEKIIYDAFEEGAKVKEIVVNMLDKYQILIENKSIQAGVYLIRKHDGKMEEISKQILNDEINDL